MRLKQLDAGQRGGAKAFVGLIRAVSRHPPPDVVRTLLYRPGFFGRLFAGLMQRVMRGRSTWTVGERELFAALTSRLNQCPF